MLLQKLRQLGHFDFAALAPDCETFHEAQMMRVEFRRQTAEHFLVASRIVGFDEVGFAFEIGNAYVLADGFARRVQTRERRRQRFDAQAGPAHGAFEKQRVGEFLAVIGADVDEDAAALAAEEILEQEPILADLGIELHVQPIATASSCALRDRACAFARRAVKRTAPAPVFSAVVGYPRPSCGGRPRVWPLVASPGGEGSPRLFWCEGRAIPPAPPRRGLRRWPACCARLSTR